MLFVTILDPHTILPLVPRATITFLKPPVGRGREVSALYSIRKVREQIKNLRLPFLK